MSRINPYQAPEDGLPPAEVRFTELRAETWPDNPRRVRIHLTTTPFLERPDIEVVIARPSGEKVSSIDIIETIENQMTFTMHLKEGSASGTFTVRASLSYQSIGLVDQRSISFEGAETAV